MIIWQYLVPKHKLSTLVHRIMRIETVWVKNAIIKWFAKQYQVNLSEAVRENTADYTSFNDFFTRSLKPDARPIAPENLICPVDGKVSQLGLIHDGQVITAKSQAYTLTQLLGDTNKSKNLENGHCMTVYLSPKDYHRIHMPCDGKLTAMTYIPGTLFSVNEESVAKIPALLARNERVICYFNTIFGEIALVLVGAVFVGSMQTVWQQKITPPYSKTSKNWTYNSEDIHLNKGEELGRFNMGSTIILILPNQFNGEVKELFTNTILGQSIQMGNAL